MASLDELRAQPGALRALRRAMERGRVASAYLFEGPSGVGKTLAARALAAEMVAGADPKVLARVDAKNHPDVRLFAPRDEGKRNIQVEVLRSEILPLAQFAPFEAEASFFIFPEADVSFPEFQSEAANALLKTLEEPRPRVHFILTSERPDALLPTIRSRCQRIRFARLPASVLQDILTEHGVPADAIGPAIALSAGRADVALALAREGAVEEMTALVLGLDDAIRAGGPGTLVDAAERLARHEELSLALQSLQNFYRDLSATTLGLSDEVLAFQHVAEEVSRRARTVRPNAAATRVSLIQDCAVAIRQNANRQVCLDSLLFELRLLV